MRENCYKHPIFQKQEAGRKSISKGNGNEIETLFRNLISYLGAVHQSF